MYRKPEAPMAIGQLLDNGFALFRAAFPTAFPMAMTLGLMAPVIGWIARFVLPETAGLLVEAGADLTIGLVAGIVVIPAVIKLVDSVAVGQPLAGADAIREGFRYFFPLLGALILVGLAGMIGLVLLVVPGIYLFVALSMTLYGVVVDDEGPIVAMRSSRYLVEGNWWRLAGIFTVGMFIGVSLYAVLALIGGATGGAAFVLENPNPDDVAEMFNELSVFAVVIELVSVFVNAVVSVFSYAFGLAIFYDLKLRRQGDDLAERIAETEAVVTEPDTRGGGADLP